MNCSSIKTRNPTEDSHIIIALGCHLASWEGTTHEQASRLTLTSIPRLSFIRDSIVRVQMLDKMRSNRETAMEEYICSTLVVLH